VNAVAILALASISVVGSAVGSIGAQVPRATVVLEPAEVVIGQPVEFRLEVPHAADRPVGLRDLELGLDESWVVLSGPRVLTRAEGEGAVTEGRWELMSLEPGERVLGELGVPLGDGSTMAVTPASLSVLGELAADEDEPRPMPAFHTLPERTSPVRPRHLGLGMLVILLAGSGWLFVRRRNRSQTSLEPDELERFLGLDREHAGDAEAVRALMFELAAVLRAAGERDVPGSWAGLSDEEWLAALEESGQHSIEVTDELGGLLVECESIKFAGSRPTRFAVEEILSRAESLLRRLVPRSTGEEG
jgi:hypothetical protein